MAHAPVAAEEGLSRVEAKEASTPVAIAAVKQHKRWIPPFWRHFLEMNIAMWVGMGLGAVVFGLLFAAFGSSRNDFRLHHPALNICLMGFAMIAGMVGWMRFRRHGWRGCAEMTAAMVIPGIPLIACLQTHVLAYRATDGLYMASMPLAMLALMLYRRGEYSMQM